MITLVGYMGSGKTTIGKSLAKKLNYEFIDLDELIEEKMGKRISEIFDEHGEEKFRTIEINLLQYAVMKGEGKAVLSTGGGTPTQKGVMSYINKVSTSFYLDTKVSELVSRLIHNKASRPILADKSKEAISPFIVKHLSTRVQFYKRAHFTIENNGSAAQSINKILLHYEAINDNLN